MYRIAALIVTYNIDEKIEKGYEAIRDQVDKIIFVDNGSNINTIKVLNDIMNRDNKVEVIFNKENLGIAKALNSGIERIKGKGFDFVITLDHDSEPSKNMIKKMILRYEELKSIENIGIICPAIYDINKEDYLTHVSNCKYEFVLDPIQSGSLYIMSLFDDVGKFNEKMFIYYVDTEFNYRVINANYKILQCNDVVLNHEEGKKTKKKILGKFIYYNNYSEFAIYYRAKNNVYMLRNHRDVFTSKDRLVKDLVKIVFFDENRVSKIKAHLKGIKDGILSK